MSPAEFDTAVEADSLQLAFVGMSNVGKSSRARALKSARSFTHAEVDTEILTELGLKNMHALTEWLGHPDSSGYKQREQQYLKLEEKYTKRQRAGKGNLVLDTTGSVAHLSKDAHQQIRERFLVVHLDVGPDAMQKLTQRFFAVPKPVVWGEHFAPRKDETLKEALTRCYPALLYARLKKFRTLAHVSIPALAVELDDGDAILEGIRSYL